jgi:hypothetical protein
MLNYAKKHGLNLSRVPLLISGFKGVKQVFISPMIKWFLSENERLNKLIYIIDNISNVIQFTPKRCFYSTVLDICCDRIEGDKNPNKKINAYLSKLQGNSMYGKFLTNVSQFNSVFYETNCKTSKYISNPLFKSVQDFDNNMYEYTMGKSVIHWKLPRYLGVFTYGYAKLWMLKFYYNFLNQYLNDKNFEILHIDTDSFYLSLANYSLRDCVKKNLLEQYDNEHKSWLVQNDKDIIECRIPGKFKVEMEGNVYTSLSSKTYSLFNNKSKKHKYVCKGINKKQNEITPNIYQNVLHNNDIYNIQNRGIKLHKNKYLTTYKQRKIGLTNLYIKREVLPDGVHTKPLHNM